MRKKSQPAALSGILKDIAQTMGFEDRLGQVRLHRIWREAVGTAIARNTEPVLVRGSVLHVHVTSPVWVQQLHFLREMLLEKLNAGLGAMPLTDIRFKIGQITGACAGEAETSELPELSAAEQQETEDEAAKIHDPEMREAFQGFMAAYLKSHKPPE